MEKISKMKLYRVIPNPLTSSSYANAPNFSFESLYYSLGYTSFTGEIYKGCANKFLKPIEEEGKFFYMFPEHAIEYLPLYPFFNNCFKLVEYEFPEDIVYDNIGVGEYGYSSIYDRKFEFPKSESYIKKQLFGNAVKATTLSSEEKISAFLENFRDTIKAFDVLNDVRGLGKSQILIDLGYDSVDDIPDDKLIDFLLEKDKAFKAFLKNDNDIVKSQFITGKSLIIHRSCQMRKEDVNKANRIILANSCFDFDYTCDGFHNFRDARYEYARLIEDGKYEESKEYIKTYKCYSK